MPRIFVYEYLTALGLGRDPASPEHSLYCEGRAMRDAVAEDFRQIPGVEVRTLEGLPADLEQSAVTKEATECRYTLLIAPEFNFILETRSTWIPNRTAKLIGSSLDALIVTRYKLQLIDVWKRHGVPTPDAALVADGWPKNRVPCVIKPVDGAGSVATFFCPDTESFERNLAAAYRESPGDPMAQDFVPGRPASVAFLISKNETVPLLPTFQCLSADGYFRYLGGKLPIPPKLAERAIRLGRKAVACVPGLFGYVGVDLILGDAADGSQDYAIEINPRLTTSYVGLRAIADFNIAEAMLCLAENRPLPEIRWKSGRVRFEPDGTFRYDPTPGAVWP
jgi:predicted ATP-grasp superfamily ATP-dependent carboligase